MSGICDTCKRESCHMRFDGCKMCDVYEGGETRYERMFGTPERAARTLDVLNKCSCDEDYICDDCALHGNCDLRYGDYTALLEWLRGDA